MAAVFLIYSVLTIAVDLLTTECTLEIFWATAKYSILDSCPGHVMLPQYRYSSLRTDTRLGCARRCSEDDLCKSFQYGAILRSCHLNSDTDSGNCSMMEASSHMIYYVKKPIPTCLHGGVLTAADTCACVGGYVGESCERFMTDCSEGFRSDHDYLEGVYEIQPRDTATSFPVYCEMKYGGRTRILYRSTGDLDFYRNWIEYRNGFGDVSDDHWLGLENILQLTKHGGSQLNVELHLLNGSFYQQLYFNFEIGNETDKYKMSFSGTKPRRLRPLGDSMAAINGFSFSTYDQDNDGWENGSCAVEYNSGWWFNNCAECNLTGRLQQPNDSLRLNVSSEVFWSRDLGNIVPWKLKMWLVLFT